MLERLKLWWNGTNISARVLNWFVRNGIVFAILFFALWISHFAFSKLETICDIITFEGIALIISGIALFVFTHIKFSQVTGNDMTTLGRHIVMGMIFLGVHIMVLGVVIGSLFINVDKEIVKEKQTQIDSTKTLEKMPKELKSGIYYDTMFVNGQIKWIDTILVK